MHASTIICRPSLVTAAGLRSQLRMSQAILEGFLGHPSKKPKLIAVPSASLSASDPTDGNERSITENSASHSLELDPCQSQGGEQPSADLPSLASLLRPDWRVLLEDEMRKPYFKQLDSFVRSEQQGKTAIYPPEEFIFRALNTVPLESVRVVILGQDPYHGPGQAMGLSFSVPDGIPLPSSLRNIYKELRDDLGCIPPRSGDLTKWSKQGVLLLNAVLTVRAASPASHQRKGWETFTDAVIRVLNEKRHGIVYILWGRYAQEKGKIVDRKKNHVLVSAHPSGLSASRGFFGCRHFSAANRWLEQEKLPQIDWQL